MSSETSRKGDVACLRIAAALVTKGYSVLQPIGDSHRYDLAIADGISIRRVQCKSALIKNGCVVFRTCSQRLATDGSVIRQSYVGQIELFGVFCPESNKVYLVSIDDTKLTMTSLRLVPTKSNRVKDIRWAKDYEI